MTWAYQTFKIPGPKSYEKEITVGILSFGIGNLGTSSAKGSDSMEEVFWREGLALSVMWHHLSVFQRSHRDVP